MTIREAFSERDLATLERAVKRFQSLGLEATLNQDNTGQATIWHVNPRLRFAPTYQYKIEKFVRDTGHVDFVVQYARSSGLDLTMYGKGQVSSNVLVFALAKAEKSVGQDLAS